MSDGSGICSYCGWDANIAGKPVAPEQPAEMPSSDSTPTVSSVCGPVMPTPNQPVTPQPSQTAIPQKQQQKAVAAAGKKKPALKAIILPVSLTLLLSLVITGFTLLHVYRGGIFVNQYQSASDTLVTPGDAASSHTSDESGNSPDNTSSAQAEIPKHSQIVRVKSKGNKATLTLEEFNVSTGSWEKRFTTNAYVGKNGVAAEKVDGDKATPKGKFNINFVFGVSKPDTNLNFKKVTKQTVWVDDPHSIYYNTWQESEPSDKDWSHAQRMKLTIDRKKVNYRIAFNFNGNCLSKGSAEPGRGSAIFVEGVGSAGKMEPGYGQINISGADMIKLLKMLDSSRNPQIIIS